MKKLFTLLAFLSTFVGGVKAQTTLFDLAEKDSYSSELGGTTTMGTVKINSNKKSINGVKFANSWNAGVNYFKVTTTDGFKSGDVITIAGAYNNKDVKNAKIEIYDNNDASAKLLYTTEQLVNGQTSADSPTEETYTLEADAEALYFGRNGGTATFITKLTILRPSSDPTLTATPTALSFSLNPDKTTDTQTFTLTGSSLTAGKTISIAPASAVTGLTVTPSSVTVSEDGTVNEEISVTYTSTADVDEASVNIVATDADDDVSATVTVTYKSTTASTVTIGYTEAIDGTTLKARELVGTDHITISDPIRGSNISDFKGTSKDVVIDGTTYKNTDSWRKNGKDTFEGENIGYTLTVESGYKMNISHVGAKIAVNDDTYTWYVEILNGAGTQIWKSGDKTSKKTGTSGFVDADVTEKEAVQGLTGTVTVNLYVKQNGGNKYFSINYLQLDVTTAIDDRPTYAMSVSQNIAEGGTVSPADGSEVTEGESVAFTATPNTGYKFVKWVIDGVDQTANPYTLENVAATHTAVAHFAKRYAVTYDIADYKGTVNKVLNNVNTGSGYDEVYSDDDDNYKIPAYADKYLYKEGNVFDKWQDGDGNTYASGATIAMTKDITLTPTFTATTQTIDKASTSTQVTWSFAKADMLFTDWQGAGAVGYSVQKATVNGETISVPMTIDASAGKVGNWNRTDAIAQTNAGTKFTIPAVKGMVIEIPNAYTAFSTTTIAGSTDYEGTGTKSISYTYNGTDETIDIVVGENNQYLGTIIVTYPAAGQSITISASGYTTLTSVLPLDFSKVKGVTAYIAKDGNAADGAITMTEVTKTPAETGLVVKGTAGKTYTIPTTTETTDNVEGNLLKGSATAETTLAANEGYILSGGKFHPCTAGTLAAGKAYLAVAAASAKSLDIVFEGEATGIAEIGRAQEATGKAVYNLAGQRVSATAKGIYVKDGKKYIK